MYLKSILIITVVYVHIFQSSADDDRSRAGVKPTVDKVLELIGVGGGSGGGGGGGGNYGSSKPAGSTTTTTTPGDNGGPDGQTVSTAAVTQNPGEQPSYGGEEVSGCKVTLPARSNCCSCEVRDICGA